MKLSRLLADVAKEAGLVTENNRDIVSVKVLVEGEVHDVIDVEYEPETNTLWLKTEIEA